MKREYIQVLKWGSSDKSLWHCVGHVHGPVQKVKIGERIPEPACKTCKAREGRKV
jgi:hypothetical protein